MCVPSCLVYLTCDVERKAQTSVSALLHLQSSMCLRECMRSKSKRGSASSSKKSYSRYAGTGTRAGSSVVLSRSTALVHRVVVQDDVVVVEIL